MCSCGFHHAEDLGVVVGRVLFVLYFAVGQDAAADFIAIAHRDDIGEDRGHRRRDGERPRQCAELGALRLGPVIEIVDLALCPCGTEDFVDDVFRDDVLGVILDTDRRIDVGRAEHAVKPIDAEASDRECHYHDERDPYPRQYLENGPIPSPVWPGGQQTRLCLMD